MKKRERIKSKIEFDNFIKNSKSIKNPFFVIHFDSKKEEYSRFGIAAGTKIGNAVVRNKLKRQLREIIHETTAFYSPGMPGKEVPYD